MPSSRKSGPKVEEVEACKNYLDRQIDLIAPRVVVTLGRHSMARAFPDEKYPLYTGRRAEVGDQIYVAMYHPAAALHQPSLRSVVERDFTILRDILDGKIQPDTFTPPPDVEQLSLF